MKSAMGSFFNKIGNNIFTLNENKEIYTQLHHEQVLKTIDKSVTLLVQFLHVTYNT